ncbi:MAG: ABC transporter permease [Chthonomonadales bacterium]|nr:ABC transporter permease [Chthonomonadales bacterium]
MNGDTGFAILAAMSVRQACPLIIAALGGVMSERAGVVNIALEGIMLSGAFVGVWAGQAWGPAVGIMAALMIGAATGGAHLAFTQVLRMNHVVSGVAINLLALHASTFLLRAFFNQADPPRQAKLAETVSMGWFIAFAFMAPFALHLLLYHTAFGLRLRAVGESAARTRLAGVSAVGLRASAVVVSGMLAACAGAYLSMALVGRFTDDMVSGRGFIALAAVICGRWTPVGAMLTCCVFGFFDALQLQLQGTVAIPSEFLRVIPYVLTIVVALVIRSSPPADLGSAAQD